MNICVLVPAFNEAKTIAGLIKQVHSQNLEVIVVDDGSSDDTGPISEGSGAIVLRNIRNEGKGASLVKGFSFALDKGFEAVITMDGDGQHLSEDIPFFVESFKNSDSAILIGNRMSCPENMPFTRILTNKLMSWFISKVAGQKICDTQCGFRLIRKEVLKKLKLATRKYETESEILIKASRLGYKIESIPVTSVYSTERSKINPFIDTLRFLRFIFREMGRKNA